MASTFSLLFPQDLVKSDQKWHIFLEMFEEENMSAAAAQNKTDIFCDIT